MNSSLPMSNNNNIVLFGIILSVIFLSVQNSFGRNSKACSNKYSIKSLTAEHHQDKAKIEIDKTAYEMFERASKNSKRKEYWKSAADLLFILDSYPEFPQLDEVRYLFANSMYEMEMYSVADKIYRYLLNIKKKRK